MIKFENVYIKYINSFYSLFNFNYSFNSHTLILGDAVNGSKAIMRILSKIDKHYTGEVYIENINIKEVKDCNLSVAYVPEFCELFKFKTVEQNLMYPLKIRKILKKDAKNIVLEHLKLFNLQNLLKVKVCKLNNNQQKIVTLLRAVIRKPNYILIENLFKNLSEVNINLATKILTFSMQNSTIIACEENITNLKFYKDFSLLELEKSDA